MSIDFHRQSAAVFVSEPAANGRDVHTDFNTTGRKQMAQVMVGEAGNPNFLQAVVMDFLHSKTRMTGLLGAGDLSPFIFSKS